jgi:hypothetical protein
MQFNEEQQAIIECDADSVIGNAFAGTGKTSMAVGYAQRRNHARVLCLVFNKSAAEDAKKRFPPNTTVKTTHSQAFATHGSKYQHKLGNAKPYHVKSVIPLNLPSDKADLTYGLALEAINQFLISRQPEILPQMVAPVKAVALGIDPSSIWQLANKIWASMCDTSDNSVPMPHDGYLKLYQLSAPDLSRRYSHIILDEGQDTNPCFFDIFDKQRTNKLIVGDQHQNIYTFRGAMNAMSLSQGAHLSLTTSFRFGYAIANMANVILSVFKDEPLELKGCGRDSSYGPADPSLYSCYLHRTNAGLFDRAVGLLPRGKKIHFVGSVNNYGFDRILDAWFLKNGESRNIRDPFIRSFSSYSAMEEYAITVEDRELTSRIKVVNNYNEHIPALVDAIKAAHTDSVKDSWCSLTTAHKAKGLEWDQVFIGDDFPELMNSRGKPNTQANMMIGSDEKPIRPDEANLIYVAVTRAKKKLILNDSLETLLDWSYEI